MMHIRCLQKSDETARPLAEQTARGRVYAVISLLCFQPFFGLRKNPPHSTALSPLRMNGSGSV